MIEVLTGLVMSIITQIVKKTEVDAKIIILALSLVFGTAFYFLKLYYPEFVENAWEKMIGSYGVSQIIYNYIIQIFEEKNALNSKQKDKWAK